MSKGGNMLNKLRNLILIFRIKKLKRKNKKNKEMLNKTVKSFNEINEILFGEKIEVKIFEKEIELISFMFIYKINLLETDYQNIGIFETIKEKINCEIIENNKYKIFKSEIMKLEGPKELKEYIIGDLFKAEKMYNSVFKQIWSILENTAKFEDIKTLFKENN